MLQYEQDIEKLQAEVEKAREGRSKILSFFGTGELAEAKKKLSDKDKQTEKLQQRITQIEQEQQRIDTLDRKANPHRYRLSSGATITGIRMSPRHSNIPSLRIQTKVGNEAFEDAKYFEWHNPVIQKYLNGELTEYELVNEILEPFEQMNQVQAQLLGATFEMLSGALHKLM